jgi:Wadjet protein JetD, C-terminal
MDKLARTLLEKLLRDSEKASVGRRTRPAALTKSNLTEYQASRSLQAREAFETVMQAARAAGAISYVVDHRGAGEGFIQRVETADIRALAGFLGRVPAEEVLASAKALLSPLAPRFPVLKDVLSKWSELKAVRTFTAADAQDWVDATRVIDYAQDMLSRGATFVPTYEASAKLFKDSKRIKKLAAPIDVLLSGNVDGESRQPSEVLEEIGLSREEHPVRMAGNVMVERERVTSYLDVPYTGLPAATIKRLVGQPTMVITIENQTTFHSEARRRCEENVLLIYTAGMPNPPWRAMYARILKELPSGVPVYHWGDIDEGGFRIAALIAQEARRVGRVIQPWSMMHPDNVPAGQRRPASPHTINRMAHFAREACWTSLAAAIEKAKCTVEQEGLA